MPTFCTLTGRTRSEKQDHYHIEFVDGCASSFQQPNTVRLINDCRDNASLATYVLAHEGIHALSLSPRANRLEEGIAESFGIAYAQLVTGTVHKSPPKYDFARRLVNRLLRPDIVKRMRLEEPRIGMIDEQLIRKHVPHISSYDVALLTSKFNE